MNRNIENKHLPITFFEKFKNAVVKIWDNFFVNDLPEQPHEIMTKKLFQVTRSVKQISNRKERLNKLHGAQEYLNYIKRYHTISVDMLKNSINSLKENKIGDISIGDIDKLKDSKKRHLMRDTLYITGNKTNANEIDETKGIMNDKIYEFMYDFNKEGRKIFRIEEQLTEELLLTDFTNIDDSFFILPYNTICIHIPYNKHLAIKEKLIEWIFITQWFEGDGKYIEVFSISKDDLITYGEFNLKGGDLIKQIVQQTNDKWDSKLARNESKDLFKFICSVLLYINSSEVDIKICQPHVIDKKYDSALPVCKLGSTIQINKRIKYIKEGENLNKNSFDFHVLKWTVRGHFRNQAIGEGRKDHKLLWIRPYIKGSERGNEEINSKPSIYQI